jgi:DHA1 family bicyclomycin/chloramphenicol resistance-like MFS transporter
MSQFEEASGFEAVMEACVFPGDAATGIGTTGASAKAKEEAAKRAPLVLAILSLLMGFASISTDLYLPAMPAMALALEASQGAIELTISGYLIGFSLGQLFWGPIGDRYGRRIPIATGIVLFVIGSAGCALSGTAGEMIFWRVVQALGACSGVVLARAMVRDLYEGDRAAQMLSVLMSVMAIAPLLGPILGAQILALSSWQAIFWTLVGVGVITLALLFLLPETLSPARRNREPLGRAIGDFVLLIGQRRLIGYAGAGGFFYGGMFAYIAGTPFAYINYHHVSPQHYGLLFAVGIIGIILTNYLNARLVMRIGSVRLLRWGATGAAFAGIVAAINATMGWGGLPGLAAPLITFVGFTGFIVANSIAGALESFPERAGAVSALIGTLQYGTGILGSALVGALANGSPSPMAWIIALSGAGSALCAWLLVPSPFARKVLPASPACRLHEG